MAAQINLSRLTLLRKRMEKLATHEGQRPVMNALAEEAMRLTLEGFDRQRDPYGKRWEPRKPPTGNWPLLDKSGKGIESLRIRPAGYGVLRGSARGYMKFHLTGTRTMVARKWWPVDGLSAAWIEAFNRVVYRRVREVLGAR